MALINADFTLQALARVLPCLFHIQLSSYLVLLLRSFPAISPQMDANTFNRRETAMPVTRCQRRDGFPPSGVWTARGRAARLLPALSRRRSVGLPTYVCVTTDRPERLGPSVQGSCQKSMTSTITAAGISQLLHQKKNLSSSQIPANFLGQCLLSFFCIFPPAHFLLKNSPNKH